MSTPSEDRRNCFHMERCPNVYCAHCGERVQASCRVGSATLCPHCGNPARPALNAVKGVGS